VARAIVAIDDEAWGSIDYTLGGEAKVVECYYGDGHRLDLRSTRILGAQQAGDATDRTSRAVRQLALSRLHHRPDRQHRRPGRRPPRPRQRGARHQRPLRRRRTHPLTLWTVPRECRLGRARHRRSQPAALGPPRQHRCQWARRRPDPAPSTAHPPRPDHPRRPTTTPASADPLAPGHRVPHDARPHPGYPAPLLTRSRRADPPEAAATTEPAIHRQPRTPLSPVQPPRPAPQRPDPLPNAHRSTATNQHGGSRLRRIPMGGAAQLREPRHSGGRLLRRPSLRPLAVRDDAVDSDLSRAERGRRSEMQTIGLAMPLPAMSGAEQWMAALTSVSMSTSGDPRSPADRRPRLASRSPAGPVCRPPPG
jgi:hypothetical protein